MSTVFVGLSGGVDSAVSAALLQQHGHSVVGAFIKIWQPEFTECTWREDRLDAMRVAAYLGVPFREIDLSQEYKNEVVESMLADYQKGITPNPDILCNQRIKFGYFAKWARKEGADIVATGHYARIVEKDGIFELHRGNDTAKDQSYFLYRLTEEDLAHTLFPVGSYTKNQVRALARRYALPVAEKRDSQGLCFVGDISLPDFLSRYIPLRTGAVVDLYGNTIGEHQGTALYTIGQRHGLTVHRQEPHYVVAIEPKTNTLTVSSSKDDAARETAMLTDVHWIHGAPSFPHTVQAQARYRERSVAAHVVSNTKVTFLKPHIAAPGQSLVVYEGEQCLGGGIIAN